MPNKNTKLNKQGISFPEHDKYDPEIGKLAVTMNSVKTELLFIFFSFGILLNYKTKWHHDGAKLGKLPTSLK